MIESVAIGVMLACGVLAMSGIAHPCMYWIVIGAAFVAMVSGSYQAWRNIPDFDTRA